MSFEPRFGHAADEFQRYRPDYPDALYERLLSVVPGDRRERAMDLGAGTGIVTAHLVPHFCETIAVEPDAGMASKIAELLPGVVIRNMTAEDCVQQPDGIDLITIANALHWMDHERVFSNARNWLRAGGILAIFDRPLPKAGPAIDAITLGELRGPWKPHRDPRLKRDLNWEAHVRAAPAFQVVEQTKFPYTVPMTASDYVGFWRSTSYGSAYALTLSAPERYWSDLACRFAEAASGEMISVDVSPTLVLARTI